MTGMPEPAQPITETEVEADLEAIDVDAPRVGIVMGSKSDMEAMNAAAEELAKRGHDRHLLDGADPDCRADAARLPRQLHRRLDGDLEDFVTV